MEVFRKKKFNEAEEIASLDMGARNQYSSINFLGECLSKENLKLMYAISALLVLVAGKASRIPKVTYCFSSIVK